MGKKWSIKISQTSPDAKQAVPAPQPKQPPADTNEDELNRLLQDPNAVLPIGEGDTQIFRLLNGKEVAALLVKNLTPEAIFDSIESSLNRQGFDRNANYSPAQIQAFQNKMDSDLKQQWGDVLGLLNQNLFNNKYSHIKGLTEEIKFYEDRKLFKLADEVTSQLKKVAKQFNADKDLGMQGVDDFFKNLLTRYACDIPECREFFCGGGGGFTMTKDYMDFMDDAMKKNPDMDLMDLNTQLQGQSDAILGQANLTPERKDKLNICYQKISQASSSDSSGSTTSGNQNVSVKQPTANFATPSREYPPSI